MVATRAEGVHDEIRGPEIHIGDPKRDQVPVAESLFQLVIFDAIGSSSVYNLVEVIMFHGSLLFISGKLTDYFCFCRMPAGVVSL